MGAPVAGYGIRSRILGTAVVEQPACWTLPGCPGRRPAARAPTFSLYCAALDCSSAARARVASCQAVEARS